MYLTHFFFYIIYRSVTINDNFSKFILLKKHYRTRLQWPWNVFKIIMLTNFLEIQIK